MTTVALFSVAPEGTFRSLKKNHKPIQDICHSCLSSGLEQLGKQTANLFYATIVILFYPAAKKRRRDTENGVTTCSVTCRILAGSLE